MKKTLNRRFKSTLIAGLLMSATQFAFAADNAAPQLSSMTLQHLAIRVTDFEATVAWYRDKLGFRIKQEYTVPEFPGIRLAHLELNGCLIEVVATPEAFQEERIPDDLGTSLNDRGLGHLAFLAADVDAVATELIKRGVKLVVPPTGFPAAWSSCKATTATFSSASRRHRPIQVPKV